MSFADILGERTMTFGIFVPKIVWEYVPLWQWPPTPFLWLTPIEEENDLARRRRLKREQAESDRRLINGSTWGDECRGYKA